MTKKTVFLFIRAFIIGVLINIGLQQVSSLPASISEDTMLQRQAQPFSNTSTNPQLDFSE
jgi:hypothetical protein